MGSAWNLGPDQLMSLAWIVAIFVSLGLVVVWGLPQISLLTRKKPNPTGSSAPLLVLPQVAMRTPPRKPSISIQLAGGALVASPGDRRFALRWGDKPVPVHVAIGGSNEKPLDGTVINLSRKGMAVHVPKEIGTGALLSICNSKYPDCTSWIQARVKRSNPKDGGWELGCQFTEPQPWNVLLLLS
jgi:hypothetical protein